MSQQINLFNPIFRKKGFSYNSAIGMLYGIGIAVAIAALGAVLEGYRLRVIQSQAQAVEQNYKQMTATGDKLVAELSVTQKPNAQLEATLAALDAQLKDRQEIITTLKSGAVGNTDGFSEYMRAFSRQSISGLWLTAFDIAGNELALQGRTLSADLVANYLKQLNQEKAMQGRRIAAVRISQPLPEIATAPPSAGPKAEKGAKEKKPTAPRFLEFTISTRDIPDGPQQTTQSTAAQAPLLGVIKTDAVIEAAKATGRQESVQ